ncbi:beta-ketoacyl synthase [Nocardia neocaledoniensis]|uniref:beta-ketoacyl synthase n=1 Tax=Nocardia neocaledoniensis TaxID=236511 RepID=UPI002454299F|nr:beta-ketoacyl synthase [Nocardia neocaledoniensis]
MTALDFDGIAFDPTGVTAPPTAPPPHPARQAGPAHDAVRQTQALAPATELAGPAPASAGHPAEPAREMVPAPKNPGEAPVIARTRQARTSAPRGVLADLRTGVVTAHRSALAAQVALQRALWTRALGTPTASSSSQVDAAGPTAVLGSPARTFDAAAESSTHRAASASDVSAGPAAPVVGARHAVAGPGATVPGNRDTAPAGRRAPGAAAREGAFKPLARTTRTELDRAALESLTAGAIAEVFGPGHRRDGVEVAARLAAGEPLVLTAIEAIELYGGTGDGRVVARYDGAPEAAARQCAEVFALFTGMYLCLSGSTMTTDVVPAHPATTDTPAAGHEPAHGTVELVVTDLDLVPRPHVAGTVTFTGGAPSTSVEVTVTEAPGAGVGPGQAVPTLLLNEFHMTHLARGDQAIAMGPEFAEYTGVRATRLPTGGLLLVDRVREFDGARGTLDHAAYTTEYDSPADSWYYADTANDSMPHFVYMETSLQAALLMGYYAGPTLTQPGTTLSLRNLGGTATVLRQVDLRDRTIEQSSRMLSTTILPGSSLQTFDYTLSVDGAPFYTGETMFGYFSDEALANQTGLDAGRHAPSWLAENPTAQVRTIDVAARRADPTAPLCSRRTLALIDQVEVVDGGGKHGAGYLHSLRPIDPADWFFARHFHLDPVIPGSLGVESVIHAVQEWLVDASHAADMADPVFRIPADLPFSWRYRGQFLPTDGTVELEAHIKALRRGPRGVTAVVDGSLWKPGLRIYEVTDLAVELVDRSA